MNTTLQLRLRVWIAASLMAILSWVLFSYFPIQPSIVDSYLRTIEGRELTEQSKLSTNGPWQTTETKADNNNSSVPIVISLEDDTDGIFSQSPHSPVDIAVVLDNLKKLGISKITSTTVFAWDTPDTISLAALDETFEAFDSCILATPLSRGPTSEPLPQSFRDASIPIKTIAGNAALIPVVNRIPIPGVILHTESLAGFTSIDSEHTSDHPYLMAQWDDRIVFSLPVLAIMQHLGLTLDDLEIRMHEVIRFGNTGIELPIDEFGRLKSSHEYFAPYTFPAAATIDADKQTFPDTYSTAILCDQRSNTSPTTLAFNQLAPAIVLQALSNEKPLPPITLSSLSSDVEILTLLGVSCCLFVISGLERMGKFIALVVTIIAILATHYGVAQTYLIWLPSMAALISTLPCWLVLLTRKPTFTYRGQPDRLDFARYSGKPKAN